MTKNSVSFRYLRKQVSKCCKIFPHEFTSQILTNRTKKLGVEHGQRMTMVRNAKSICLPCVVKTD